MTLASVVYGLVAGLILVGLSYDLRRMVRYLGPRASRLRNMARIPTPLRPRHLAASMRVVASHLHMRRVDVASARQRVIEAAAKVADGVAGPDTLELVARLEKVTGCSIADLAGFAGSWQEA